MMDDRDRAGTPRRFDGLLPVTSAVAMALIAGGCSPAQTANRDVAICRDAQGQRIDDANCRGVSGHEYPASWGDVA